MLRGTGIVFHMVWSSPRLGPYWREVAETLSNRCGVELPLDPRLFLLSYLGAVEGDRYTKLCITFALFYARRKIFLRWRGPDHPTRSSWLGTINRVLPLYRIMYGSRNCPAKFDKIWSSWIDSSG